MPVSTIRSGCLKSTVSGAAGLLLAGMAASPAYADSFREREWHLTAMRAEQMWKISTGKGITVAVIDTGVDEDLPDLQGRVLTGKDEAPASPGDERTDYDGHGTTMALLIAGSGRSNGGNGTFGLAPGAKILPIRVADRGLDSNRYTQEFNETVSVGIQYAADHGAQVINVSLRALEGSQQLSDAVKYALDKGSLVFAGTGNDGTSGVEYPAGTPGVVAVGAVGKDLHKTEESQYGPQVDIAAPGDELYHVCPTSTKLCRSHGTSGSTALASASAALIWSQHPNWTNNQVLRVMLNTIGGPTDGVKRNDSIGYGIVRPRVALRDPGNPGPADTYPLPDLAAAASAAPSASAAEPQGTGVAVDGDNSAATAPESEDGGNGTLWTTLGIGLAVLLGGAAASLLIARKRRRGAAPGSGGSPHRGERP